MRGYSLLEMVVVLAILSLLTVMGYRGITLLIDSEQQLRLKQDKWQRVEQFFARFEHDLQRALPRAGLSQPVWLSVERADATEVRFIRANTRDERQGSQVVGYRFREGRVEWLSFTVSQSELSAYPILDEVQRFTLLYLDSRGNWLRQWPDQNLLPRAVWLELQLGSGEEIERWFLL